MVLPGMIERLLGRVVATAGRWPVASLQKPPVYESVPSAPRDSKRNPTRPTDVARLLATAQSPTSPLGLTRTSRHVRCYVRSWGATADLHDGNWTLVQLDRPTRPAG
jgi:hypothetical protein